MIYLDPKADLPFKKVFGEHKNLAKSLLNALLPLSDEEKITDVEYLDTEMLPDAPWRKNTIVDVHCTDSQGRQFLVEMQLHWNHEFKNRVLLNAAKAFVRQSRQGESYMLLQPVVAQPCQRRVRAGHGGVLSPLQDGEHQGYKQGD